MVEDRDFDFRRPVLRNRPPREVEEEVVIDVKKATKRDRDHMYSPTKKVFCLKCSEFILVINQGYHDMF